MKKMFLFLAVLCNAAAFSQDYAFQSASTRKVKSDELFGYLNKYPGKTDSIVKAMKVYLKDGSERTHRYTDSLAAGKDGHKYKDIFYIDTLTNTFSLVYHLRTKKEIKEENKYWNEYFKADKENRKKLMGSTVTNLIIKDMDNLFYTDESLKGKIVVLDFWFTTCAACIKEMPALNKLKEEFRNNEIIWFGVTYNDKEKVAKFLEKVKYDFTIVPDSQYLVDKFGIKFFPTTLVIDQKGKIVYTGEFSDYEEKPEKIRKLLVELTRS